MASAANVLAATFGWDVAEVREYEYQKYTAPKVYSIGERYFAVSSVKPKHKVGTEWKWHSDQFFATNQATTIWVCDVKSA